MSSRTQARNPSEALPPPLRTETHSSLERAERLLQEDFSRRHTNCYIQSGVEKVYGASLDQVYAAYATTCAGYMRRLVPSLPNNHEEARETASSRYRRVIVVLGLVREFKQWILTESHYSSRRLYSIDVVTIPTSLAPFHDYAFKPACDWDVYRRRLRATYVAWSYRSRATVSVAQWAIC
ncbi:hypothetical protein BC629DRAFT_1740490, partial [Irpex lacteus]